MSQAEARNHLRLNKSSVSYRVKRLLTMGYLGNIEDRKGKPMKLVPGAPLPDEPAPLPSPSELAKFLVQESRDDLVMPWVDPVTREGHDCLEHFDTVNRKKLAVLPETTMNPRRGLYLSRYLKARGS